MGVPSDAIRKMDEAHPMSLVRTADGFAVPESRGRPWALDSQKRAIRMAELVASGVGFKDAARDARVSPWRALELVDDPSWRALVEGFKEAA